MKNSSFLSKFNNINKQFYLEKNFNHLKLRFSGPCNFLTKRTLVSQPSTLVIAKDANILHYFDLAINLATIVPPII